MSSSPFPMKWGTMLSQGKDGVKGRALLLRREGATGRGICTLFSLVLCRWASNSSSYLGAGYRMMSQDSAMSNQGLWSPTTSQGAVRKVAGRRSGTDCVFLVSSEGSEWTFFRSSTNSGSWIPSLYFWLRSIFLSKTKHFFHLCTLSLMKHTQCLPAMFF